MSVSNPPNGEASADDAEDPATVVLFHHGTNWSLFWRHDGLLILNGKTYEEVKEQVRDLGFDLDQVERRERSPGPARDPTPETADPGSLRDRRP